jgi:hypothetical protein
MKARDIPKDAFPIVLESDDPNVPSLIWGGHVTIVFERKKKEEENGARTEEAAQGS